MFKSGRLQIAKCCVGLDRGLRNHEWAKQAQEGMKAKEAQDSWKHWSDLIRYLALAAIWPAEQPEAVIPDDGIYRERISDLFEMARPANVDYLSMDMEDWEKLHAA